MISGALSWQPGTLRQAVEKTTVTALRGGALHPIATEQLEVADGGVRFLVRMVSSLRRKAAAGRAEGGRPAGSGNPFLPPEPGLTVGQVTPSHLALLNKYNVLPRHLLIVTRAFAHQDALLTPGDFRALLACMAEYEALGFYNGGKTAGASQAHKHLQLVPLPLDPQGPALPILPLLAGGGPTCPAIPFAHAFGRLSAPVSSATSSLAEEALELYLRLLGHVGVRGVRVGAETRQSGPYNLLVAGDWMLLVPRSAECHRGISVNALGFAGSLFVKDREQLERVRSDGPMRILTAVSGDRRRVP
jgi:ATP adenylyltransferase